MLAVVAIFETTENTKSELHQTRAMRIFFLFFVGAIFETTENTKAE
jgi:hypothetical protein